MSARERGRLLSKLADRLMEKADEVATLETLEPIGDIHAPPEYRRHLAGVLLTRAVRDAASVCGIAL